MPFYIIKQAFYHFNILLGSKSIKNVLLENNITNKQKEKLELIVKIKTFAEENLGLINNKNYTTVNIKWNKTLYGLSGCEKYSFKPYIWKFPIVGDMRMKGFFDKNDMNREKQKLIKKNYEVNETTITAYSTLGFFKDPILKTMLDYKDDYLIHLIIHELVHSKLYFKNNPELSESLAQYVALNMGLFFVTTTYSEKSTKYAKFIKYNKYITEYNAFMRSIYSNLNDLYTSTNIDKKQQKKSIINQARKPFEEKFKNKAFPKNFNNAFLIRFKTYNSKTEEFNIIFKSVGQDWKKFMTEMEKINTNNISFNDLLKQNT